MVAESSEVFPYNAGMENHTRPAMALVLIAHGSRQDEANTDLHHVVADLRRRGRYVIVEASFLELAEPDIEEAAGRCVARGARRVLLLPYFLSAGVHVRRDLTVIRARLARRHPAVEFRLGEPLGRHPLMLEVVAERARQAEGGPAAGPS
jgi:sirohydrochlorin ferrochelatase